MTGNDEPRTDLERLGGREGLRTIILDFVERVFDDVMIGFLFAGKSRTRLAEMEYQLAAWELGGSDPYAGRDLGKVHAPLAILGGHFLRRRKILQDTLRAHNVPADIEARWLERVDALRETILGSGAVPDDCSDRRSR